MTIMTGTAITTNAGRTILNQTGNVIQCVQYNYPSLYTNSSTRNTEYDMPGVLGDGTATITPSYSSNRILIMHQISLGNELTWRSTGFRTYYKIGAGSWVNYTGGFAGITYANTTGCCITIHQNYLLSSLNTTSTVAFKLTFVEHNDGGNMRLNDNNNTGSLGSNLANTSSSITIWEIAA